MRCRMCGKRITNPESLKRGFGPVCWAELHPQQVTKAADDEPEIIQIPGQIDIEDWLRDCDGKGGEEGTEQE